MASALVQRASAAYRIHLKRTIAVRSYLSGYGTDEEDNSGNGKRNGNGKSDNGGIGKRNGNGNKKSGDISSLFSFRKPADVIDDLKRDLDNFNKVTDLANLKKTTTAGNSSPPPKGLFSSFKEQYLAAGWAAIATVGASIFHKFVVPGGQKLLIKFFQLKYDENRIKSASDTNITPCLTVIRCDNDVMKFQMPMPGMDLGNFSYSWDVEGQMLTIRADNGEEVFRYTAKVTPKFRHGEVLLESLVKGYLVVAVTAKAKAVKKVEG